jgi:hypothetical protein
MDSGYIEYADSPQLATTAAIRARTGSAVKERKGQRKVARKKRPLRAKIRHGK